MIKLTCPIVIVLSMSLSTRVMPVKFTLEQIRLAANQRENETALLKASLHEIISSKQNQNKKIDLGTYSEYPLVLAAREGYLTELTELLENGADPNLGYPLHETIEDHPHVEYFQCASLLLDYGADPNRKKYDQCQDQVGECIIIEIIARKTQFYFDQNQHLKPKYTTNSYKEFITKLLRRTNPYLTSKSGKNLIELTQERIKKSKKSFEVEEATNFFISLLNELKKLKESDFAPKSLKELALRKVIAHNFHITYKDALPVELQEEAKQYSKRKDMIHLIKKYDSQGISNDQINV